MAFEFGLEHIGLPQSFWTLSLGVSSSIASRWESHAYSAKAALWPWYCWSQVMFAFSHGSRQPLLPAAFSVRDLGRYFWAIVFLPSSHVFMGFHRIQFFCLLFDGLRCFEDGDGAQRYHPCIMQPMLPNALGVWSIVEMWMSWMMI